MIEEQGRVVAVEEGAVWVETVKQAGCASCSARNGCGHKVLDGARAGARARVRALCDEPGLQVDEQVVVGIPEGLLMRGAVLVYLVPLLLLFLGALVGRAWFGAESQGPALLGLMGLGAGFILNRWHSGRYRDDAAHHPRVIRRVDGSGPARERILCG